IVARSGGSAPISATRRSPGDGTGGVIVGRRQARQPWLRSTPAVDRRAPLEEGLARLDEVLRAQADGLPGRSERETPLRVRERVDRTLGTGERKRRLRGEGLREGPDRRVELGVV